MENYIKKIKYLNTLIITISALLLVPVAAKAVPFGFGNISANEVNDAMIGEAQLSVDVTDAGGGQVSFIFNNIGPEASSVTDAYFDGGSYLGIATIVNGTGVDFSQGAKPGNLPAGGNATPPFVATSGLTADSNPPTRPNGVDPGEMLETIFELQGGHTFGDVLDELRNGILRVGIHVQGYASGGSESFIHTVPEPSTMLLLGIGLVGLIGGAVRRRLKGRRGE